MPSGLHVKKLLWNLIKHRKDRHESILWQTFLAWPTDTSIFVQEPVFPLSQFEHTFCFALSVCFCAQICWFEEKNFMVCIFAVIYIFLLPSDHVVDKMSVSHANLIWKYIMYLILFENYWFENYWFLKSYKSLAFHPTNLRNFFATCARKSKQVCKDVSKSKMFAHYWFRGCGLGVFLYVLIL